MTSLTSDFADNAASAKGEVAQNREGRNRNASSRPEWLTGIERRSGFAVLALALALYGAILALKVSAPDPGDAVLLVLVVPIALLAIRFGVLGGAAAGLIALLLIALSEALGAPSVGALGYLARALTFLTLGLMFGSFADQLRHSRAEMEARVAHGPMESSAANAALRSEVSARAQAEQALASERDFLAAVLESLDTGIVACDGDGVLTLFNQATRRIHGLPERALPADEWAEHYDLRRADGRTPMPTDEIPLRRALAGERIREVQMVIAPRGKDPRTFLASGQPIIDSRGNRQGAVVAMHDITERLRAEARLQAAIEEALTRLARAVEYRDLETGDHIGRMSRHARLIAEAAGLEHERCAMIEIACRMHDVGKLGVPDRVLLKPGKLDHEERELMQHHTLTGHALLTRSGNELLELAATIALTHHERVDGTGYPHGLAGDAIPLEGRIVALADVFDALTSDRVYRSRFSLQQALSIMAEGRGSQFDADLFDVFMEVVPKLVAAGQEKSFPAAGVTSGRRPSADI